MPELPEVETVKRDLEPLLVGAVFEGVRSEVPKVIKPSLESFDSLVGLKVVGLGRRGKFLNIFFEQELVVTVHLRMTGRLIVQKKEDEALKFERSRLDFDKLSVRFCDMRKFGRVWLSDVESFERETGIWKLGVEPLEGKMDFRRLFAGKSGTVKKNLLDQGIVAGIGNIYADESCFYAGILPDREMKSLSDEELELLHGSVIKALEQGVRNRGTSVKDYADAYGKSGKNQEVLFVYGRGGKQCLRCSRELIKTKVAGRGTVYCAKCQK